MRCLALFLFVLFAQQSAPAAEVTDATGRTVIVPDQILHVLPAGPPAAVLLAAIAPEQTMGFTVPLSAAVRAALPPELGDLPVVPRLTAGADMGALHPDLIIDYGTISPRYVDLARDTQQKTGVPTILFDGGLDQIPAVARTLGRILHQPERAETVARVAEAILALSDPAGPASAGPSRKVYYARGPQGTLAAAAGTDVTAVFARLGWTVVAPEGTGTGTFRTATVPEIAALDPDVIILADPAAKQALTSAPWSGLRAVRDGHAVIAPAVPFGWIEEPPSINRLLGLAWLRGSDPTALAALFNATVYGRVLTLGQLAAFSPASIEP